MVISFFFNFKRAAAAKTSIADEVVDARRDHSDLTLQALDGHLSVLTLLADKAHPFLL